MKPVIKIASFILLITALVHISCKKEYSCEGCAAKNNKPPNAVAGPDQVITLPIDSVLLDGRNSSDADGNISSWLWTKILGPASFTIIRPFESITKVKTFVPGIYQFELSVSDNGGLSAKDTVMVTVNSPNNLPPIYYQDSLTGKAFIFDGLVWAYDFDGGGNLYIGIENRPDLFADSSRPVEVSVKPDSLNIWLATGRFQYPVSLEYVYGMYSNSLFIFHHPHIFPWSPDSHLAGAMFSVRVKFL